MAKNERLKALDLALTQIEKDFGKDAIMRLGEKHAKMPVAAIPTGILPLDIAIGVGGIPRGRVIEIFGPEAGGKTTLSLCIVAQAQKAAGAQGGQGGIAAFIDAEHAMDPEYAKQLGVDIDNLLISQPDSGEQALEIADKLVRSGAVDIIVIDSVAALVPRAEIEGEMGDSHVGLQARLMSQALRKLTSTIAKSRTSVIFINQVRQKIGVMWGNPETTPGGLALKFYSSVRLDIRRIASVKKGDEVIANRVRVKVVKNKVAPPFKQAEFEISFGRGIDRYGYLIDMSIDEKLVEKSGTFFSYKNEKIGQGRENAKLYLHENQTIADEIEDMLRQKYFGEPAQGRQANMPSPNPDSKPSASDPGLSQKQPAKAGKK